MFYEGELDKMASMEKTTIMRRVVATLAICVAACLALMLFVPGEAQAASKVKLSKTKATILMGKATTLKLNGAKASKVKWTSSKKSVATVKAGKVSAKKAGQTNITATYKGKKYKCKITVTKLVMSKTGTLYAVGKSYIGSYEPLKVKCYKHGARCTDVKFSSSNKRVARVDEYGNIEARSVGTTTIKVKAHGTTVKQKISVKMSRLGLAQIPTLYLGCPEREGDYVAITCQAHPGPEGYSWCENVASSSNSNIVSVSEDGELLARGSGQATVTVRAHGQTASQVVTVKKPWVALVLDSTDLFYDGESSTAEAWCAACETRYNNDGSAVFSSSDSSVVQVSKYGTITPLKVGTATITARVHGVTASRAVNVKLAPYTMSNNTMTLSLKRFEDYWDAESVGVECGVCGGWCYKAAWKSSNPAIVEVDGDGWLTPKAKGVATITASAHGTSASCTVTVID